MDAKKISIKGEYIQLNQLLKLENAAQSGGQAKWMIESGEVLVNGVRAEAVRKKLRAGDRVEGRGFCFEIVSNQAGAEGN